MNDTPSSMASNPGRVPFELFTYWSCYRGRMLFPVGLLGVGAVLLLAALLVENFSVAAGIAVMIFGAFVLITIESRMKQWMALGDTCPALVLDADTGLIAVWADMTTTLQTSQPAIKILRAPVFRGPLGRTLQNNSRLSVVCTFRGSPDNGRWDDVKPIPVVCATRNPAVIQRSLTSIPESQWEQFTNDLQSIEQTSSGLYFLSSRAFDVEALAEQMTDRMLDQQMTQAAADAVTESGASYNGKLATILGASFLVYLVATVLISMAMEKAATDGSIRAFGPSGLIFGLLLAVPAFLSVASLGMTTMPQSFFQDTRMGRKLVEFVGGAATPSGVKSVCLVAGLLFFAITIGLYYVIQNLAP